MCGHAIILISSAGLPVFLLTPVFALVSLKIDIRWIQHHPELLKNFLNDRFF